MNQNEFDRLIERINECKHRGLNYLADNIFALLLDNLEGKKADVLVETDDPLGTQQSCYYDLVTIVSSTGSACIPTPLLDSSTVGALYKRAFYIDRVVHDRYVEGFSNEAERLSFVEEIINEVSEIAGQRDFIACAIRKFLVEKEIDEVWRDEFPVPRKWIEEDIVK